MSEFSIPYEFIAGTKAKAEEVNANFNAVKNELTQKASKNGSAATALSVANGTLPEHAVNKSQLELLSTTLSTKIDSKTTPFCAKSGNTTEGNADLFSHENLLISVKIGDGTNENYLPLVIVNHKGESVTKTTLNSISMSGKADGDYNIFCPIDGDAYVIKNTIYRQAKTPTMLENDIWLDISTEPLKAFKFNGTENIEFGDVPLGNVKTKEGVITALTTNHYNQNNYGVNALSKDWGKLLPDYSKAINQASGITHTAKSNGFIFGKTFSDANGGCGVCAIVINEITISQSFSTSSTWMPYCYPVKKGDTYSVTRNDYNFAKCMGEV